MRFRLLATDYDNTIAFHGAVSAAAQDALERVHSSGRALALVTGRTRAELDAVFAAPSLFDVLVLENGALLEHEGREELIGAPVPEPLVAAMRRSGLAPVAVGRTIVSTAAANAERLEEIIDALHLDLVLHYNRDSVMVLSPGVDKAVGLRRAATLLDVPMHDVIAVGDGENDCAMLRAAGAGVAVDNALQAVKDCADVVLTEAGPDGIRELCDSLVRSDLGDLLGSAAPQG